MITQRKVFRGALVLTTILMLSHGCNDPEDVNANREFQLPASQKAFLNITEKALYGDFGNAAKGEGNLNGVPDPDEFMDRLAAAVSDDDFQYESLSEEEYNEASGKFTEEFNFSTKDLSPRVRQHLEHFSEEIDKVVSSYERGDITDKKGIDMIKRACASEGRLSYNDEGLNKEEKEAMANVFYSYEQLTPGLANYIEQLAKQDSDTGLRGAANMDIDAPPSFLGGFFRRVARAVARVVVAAVVTAAIVAVAVAVPMAIAAIKGKVIVGGFAKIGSKVLYGSKWKVKKFSLSKSPVVFGAGAGLKNARKRWKKSWHWSRELKYGYKFRVEPK